jgi:outer membrane protein assembly factor BamB
MKRALFIFLLVSSFSLPTFISAGDKTEVPKKSNIWPQWRGPSRDGQWTGPAWPDRLSKESLPLLWRIPLGPSYSGPVVAEDLVFTTETKNKESEVVYGLDRKTGKERWRAEWKGAMTVPFFAAPNGSWIRSTPAYDGERLYVAGMRDVLVCLDAKTGKEEWRVDFVKELKTPLPDFGFVCSPLVDGDAVYVQAGACAAKLDKKTGKISWRTLEDKGGMFASAFSSPVIATLSGKRQLVVQGREKLAGVDLENGAVLWSQVVPSFRGMNILTPTVVGDAIFTSSYQNKAWLYKISREGDRYTVAEVWTSKAQAYMSTPVVIDGHAYLHLQNQRFTCIDLKTGGRTWTSKAFGKYCSLVAQGDRILALDQRGVLLLIKANPKEFELLDEMKISDADTWAHLAVSGDELFIRELNALAVHRWQIPKK